MPKQHSKHLVITLAVGLLLCLSAVANADHVTGHATACNDPITVGGGTLGVSPGPVGPPNSLGWDVGNGQCNGSFSVTSDGAFPGGALELALRAEQRRIGQVAPTGPNDYTVQTGPDIGPPLAFNRAWWNFQGSIGYGGSIANLDSLTLVINTDVGPNLPAAPVVDLLAFRVIIDDRNNQPNATVGFADLYQISQNPEFGWFAPTSDTDPNPSTFDYDAPGAWRFTITATKGGSSASVSVCIHTPGQTCAAGDADGDGVSDDVDVCGETVVPEPNVPSRRLGTNRFALADDSGVFATTPPKGKGPGKSFTIEDTAGCSCEQIIVAQRLGSGHTKFGCSISAMEDWVGLVNPAGLTGSLVSGSASTDVMTKRQKRQLRRALRRLNR